MLCYSEASKCLSSAMSTVQVHQFPVLPFSLAGQTLDNSNLTKKHRPLQRPNNPPFSRSANFTLRQCFWYNYDGVNMIIVFQYPHYYYPQFSLYYGVRGHFKLLLLGNDEAYRPATKINIRKNCISW